MTKKDYDELYRILDEVHNAAFRINSPEIVDKIAKAKLKIIAYKDIEDIKK